jgi:hypothetical protein
VCCGLVMVVVTYTMIDFISFHSGLVACVSNTIRLSGFTFVSLPPGAHLRVTNVCLES